VVYLFGRGDLELRTRRLCKSTRNNGDTTNLYWFGPPESKTLRPVLGVCIADEGIVGPRKDGLGHLILADGQGRWTRSPDRLQHGNLSKVVYDIIL
jgi:hypothetical protein